MTLYRPIYKVQGLPTDIHFFFFHSRFADGYTICGVGNNHLWDPESCYLSPNTTMLPTWKTVAIAKVNLVSRVISDPLLSPKRLPVCLESKVGWQFDPVCMFSHWAIVNLPQPCVCPHRASVTYFNLHTSTCVCPHRASVTYFNLHTSTQYVSP